jgi:hypothetical protein
MSAYIAVRYFDQAVSTGKAKKWEDWFRRYAVAQDEVKANPKKV